MRKTQKEQPVKAIEQRLKNTIWFLPLDKFAIGFALYFFVGVVSLSMSGMNLFKALALTLLYGVILTAIISVALPLWRLEHRAGSNKPLAWRLLFGPLRSDPAANREHSETSAIDNSEPPPVDVKPDSEPPSGIEDEKFKRRMRANQIDSAKRDSKKMHDKVIHTGLVVALYMLAFWFAADSLSGFFATLFGSGSFSSDSIGGPQGQISFASPKELFTIGWIPLIIMWLFLIVYLPRWLVFILLVSASGIRLMFVAFGPMSSMFVMQIGMLPVFYTVMMVFFFGSIMWPFLQQFKYFRPGDASWGTPKGSMRGQPEVRATVETELAKFKDFIEGKSKRAPTRGMIFEGPPGTGKTLYAKEIATEYNLPFIFADGAAFSGVPLPNLIMKYIEWRTNSLADEYGGGAVFFIDEAEVFLQVRQGMGGGAPIGGMETTGIQYTAIRDVWDLLTYDSIGATSSCGVIYDSSQARERFWQLKSPLCLGKKPRVYTHSFFMPVGMGGGSGMLYPFLTWLQGTGSPPVMETLKRRIINDILNALFIPVNIPGTQVLLRMPAAKLKHRTILFIGATNRAFMIDPAIRRPGRMGVPARFKTPDFESRLDIIDLYFTKADKDGLLRPELLRKEAIEEFARAVSGMSPAEIEASINTSYDVRSTHINNLKRIKSMTDRGVPFEKLLEGDRKYWLRNEDELKNDNWDDERADMRSLLEARNALIYGRADPGLTTAEHREQTAWHEYSGHLFILKAALGMKRKYNVMRPSVLSIMPRGNALGMVAHIPVEERDPKPQRFYEGLLRVSVGSIVTERFFFGENQPGVSSDLENATRIACFMVGKAGMVPYKCTDDERKKFIEIGETLIAVPDPQFAPLNPFAKDFIERIISDPSSRERVAIMLGQAFVDDYRLIRANVVKDYAFHRGVVLELLRLDEIGGAKLEAIWDKLDEILVIWDEFNEEQRSWWPDKITRVENYFYSSSNKPEVEEVLTQ